MREEMPMDVKEVTPEPTIADSARIIEKARTPSADVREYFKIGKFQKRAESIDLDKTHPWNTVHSEGCLVANDFGAIVAGETYDKNVAQTTTETPFGFIIAEKTHDGHGNSIFVKDFGQIRGRVMDAINIFAPSLPDETRHQFIRNMIRNAPVLENTKGVAEKLAIMGLELLPDYENSSRSEPNYQWIGPNGETPTDEQQEQLSKFIGLAASKMPAGKLEEHMQKFQDGLKFTEDPFGINYNSIFGEIARWVLNGRVDTKRNNEILQNIEPDEYTIKDKVTRQITTEDNLRAILATLPVEPMPDTKKMNRSDEIPEMVSLNRVWGGTEIKNWSVSTSPDRGLPRIFKFTRDLQNGAASVAGNNQPIKMIEVDGKFYVEADGRHRTAALKALGVAEIPAMVTHIK